MTEVLRMGFGVIAIELIVVIIYLRRIINFFIELAYMIDLDDWEESEDDEDEI